MSVYVRFEGEIRLYADDVPETLSYQTVAQAVQNVIGHTGPQIIYRTPAEVRAIPNAQWEDWLKTDSIPWSAFSSERWTQKALHYARAAHQRRMGT